MSHSRLFIAVDVLDFLRALSPREQRDLLKCFREIAESPARFADFTEPDAVGRQVDVHVFGKFAIKFWNDFADRHVKILDVHFADKSP
jgi:hypothetical protein